MWNRAVLRVLVGFASLLFVVGNSLADDSVGTRVGKPELRVYSHRVNPVEHPDFKLVPYERIHREMRPGGLDLNKEKLPSVHAAKMNREPGERNSFDADETLVDLLSRMKDARLTYPDFAGTNSGESDWFFSRWTDSYYSSLGRFDQDRHWNFIGKFYDAFGRLSEYQFKIGYDAFGVSYLAQSGIGTTLSRQIEIHTGLRALYYNMECGASRQYGLCRGMGYGYIQKYYTPLHYEAKKSLGSMDLHSYSGTWRAMVRAYMASAVNTVMVGQNYLDDPHQNLTTLGEFTQTLQKNLLFAYPNPGSQLTPIAFMQDFFHGWKHADRGSAKGKGPSIGVYGRWDGSLPFEEGDYALLNYFSVLYPDSDPRTPFNKEYPVYLAGESHTPYGDIVDIIMTDARPELLNRYSMVVLVSPLRADVGTLRDKLEDYVSNGGNLLLCAEHAKQLFPEYGLQAAESVPAGAKLRYASGKQVTEPYAFTRYSAAKLPARAKRVLTYDGKPVMVEIPLGSGLITLDFSAYGMAHEPVELPAHPYVMLKHVKDVLEAKAEAVQLFSAGKNPHIHYITTRDPEGWYTLAVLNQSEAEQRFEIKSDHLSIDPKTFMEINVGDPSTMIADGPYFYSCEDDPLKRAEEKAKKPKLGGKEAIAYRKGKRSKERDKYKMGQEKPVETIFSAEDKIRMERVKAKQLKVGSSGRVAVVDGAVPNTTIIGGGVRVFRFKLSSEAGVNVVPKKLYPPRPADWYVHLPLQQLYHRLTRMPEFFHYFGGVKIDGSELLGTSHEILRYDFGWYRVRHVDFIVDSRGISDVARVQELIHKAGQFPYGAKVVLAEAPGPALKTLAAGHGVELMTAAEGPLWIEHGKVPSASDLNDPAKIKVLNFHYAFGNDQWERIYGDLRQLVGKHAKPATANLSGRTIRKLDDLTTARAVSRPVGTQYYVTLLRIDDLPKWIDEHPEILTSKISGINLDSGYVFGKTQEQLRHELNWLRARGLEVVVDISRYVQDFRDISYQKMPLRVEGRAMLENVMQKMQGLGLPDLIFAPPNREDWNEEDVDAALRDFFAMADNYGITLHVRSLYRIEGISNHPLAQKKFRLVRNVYDYDPWEHFRLELRQSTVPSLDNESAVPLSPFVSVKRYFQRACHPIADFEPSKATDLHAFDGKILLLDPEYVDWPEIQADLDFIGNTPPAIEDHVLYVSSQATVGSVVGSVEGYDGDIACGISQELKYVLTGGSGAALFKINASSGEIVFAGKTPLTTGDRYTLDVTVSDSIDPERSDEGVVTLLIQDSPNRPPVVNGQTVEVNEDASTKISLGDSGATGGEGLSFSVVDHPRHGTLTGTAPNLVYTPDKNFSGSDSFTFQARNGDHRSSLAKLTLAVTGQNDAPVFNSRQIDKGKGALLIPYKGRLAESVYDPDGDALTFRKLSGPDWLVVEKNGELSGTPTLSDFGRNMFAVEAKDTTGKTATAAFEISVFDNPSLWANLITDDFEFPDVFGNWVPNSKKLNDKGKGGYIGNKSLLLSNELGLTSIVLAKPMNLRGASYMKIDFRVRPTSPELGGNLLVDFSNDGGSSWQTVECYDIAKEFVGGMWEARMVSLKRKPRDFTSNVKVRFRIEESGKKGSVFLDNVCIAQLKD